MVAMPGLVRRRYVCELMNWLIQKSIVLEIEPRKSNSPPPPHTHTTPTPTDPASPRCSTARSMSNETRIGIVSVFDGAQGTSLGKRIQVFNQDKTWQDTVKVTIEALKK